ncbi:MAG: hypothetical protein WC423_13930 [Vulcanimicrobiota bacterium]
MALRLFNSIRLLALCFLVLATVTAQQISPEDRFLEARGKALDGYFDEAIIELSAISTEYPGTDIDAMCRFEKAIVLLQSPENAEQADVLYSEIITDFAGTPFEFYAEQQRLDLLLHRGQIPVSTFVDSLNLLIVRAGGTEVGTLSLPFASPVGMLAEQDQNRFLIAPLTKTLQSLSVQQNLRLREMRAYAY